MKYLFFLYLVKKCRLYYWCIWGKKKYIDHRLYREHCIVRNNEFIKDISRIGRNIEKMIIVDNLPLCFMLQKENGINIRSYWEEDKNDVVL